MLSQSKRGRLLYRVIFSHLLVAVPPAVVLGLLVNDINRNALKLEAQQLHLAVAARFRDALRREVDTRRVVVGEAERLLDMDEVELDRRKTLLRALVASSGAPYVAIYGPSGKLDTVIRAAEAGEVDRRPLPPELREELAKSGWGLTDAVIEGSRREAMVVVAWVKDGTPFGFLGAPVDLGGMSEIASELRSRYLGDAGEIDVVDGAGRYLASSIPDRVGGTAAAGTAFEGYQGGKAREGMAATEMGLSPVFQGPDGARLGAIVSDPELRWMVGVSRPERVAFAALEQVKLRVALLSIVAGLAAGLLGLLLARTVSEPIRQLIKAVRTSRKSGFVEGVDVDGPLEVAQLGDAFNDAVRELSSHRTELRQKAQLQLRLARFLPPTMLHEVLSREMDVRTAGEKVHTTVLYADLAGDQAFGENVPAEHLVSILGEFFAAACASVERNGGRIDRYSGDAVIGIFSAGDAVDHARRAMTAALDVLKDTQAISARWREAEQVEVMASVGVVTGEAVLGEAPDGSGEVTVVGSMVERAAALQESAASGQVAADRETHDAAGQQYQWRAGRPRTQATRTVEMFVVDPATITGEEAKR